MTALNPPVPRPVLADLVPGTRVRDAALVIGAALLTAACAQVVVPLPFSPVPLTGQTFAVLLTGVALGPARGALGQGLYVVLGAVGLPFYANGASGLQVVMGATGGYLVGFVLAAALVGWLARRGCDRRPLAMAGSFVLGSLLIYAVGVPWLAVTAGLAPVDALVRGAAVFVVGDAIKAALAAGLLPALWRFADPE